MTAIAALNFLANADALIIDLRSNGGGSPSMIQLITSYFFDKPVHLNSFYTRATDSYEEFWTHEEVEGKRMTDVKIYILTSGYTFSAAEEFTYNLKNLKRGTVIGETTGGGAHPVTSVDFPEDGFRLVLPFGKAVNPITKTNWEGTGVSPNIKTSEKEAWDVAYEKAVSDLLSDSKDPGNKVFLKNVAAGIKLKMKPVVLNADKLKSYCGVYGGMKVEIIDGKLSWRGVATVPMGNDVFLQEYRFGKLRFERDASGKISAIVDMGPRGGERKFARQ